MLGLAAIAAGGGVLTWYIIQASDQADQADEKSATNSSSCSDT
jgi:hypothetical protein